MPHHESECMLCQLRQPLTNHTNSSYVIFVSSKLDNQTPMGFCGGTYDCKWSWTDHPGEHITQTSMTTQVELRYTLNAHVVDKSRDTVSLCFSGCPLQKPLTAVRLLCGTLRS